MDFFSSWAIALKMSVHSPDIKVNKDHYSKMNPPENETITAIFPCFQWKSPKGFNIKHGRILVL